MLDRFHRFVGRFATWPVAALLFLAFVILMLGFTARSARLGSTPPVLDTRLWYTPAEVQTLFDKLGADGRSFYALTEITLDLLFPLVYGGILLIMMWRLFEPGAARWLLLLPAVGMVMDWLENFSAAGMAWTYTGAAPGWAAVARVFSLLKNVLGGLGVALVLVGAVRDLILKRSGEETPRAALG